MGTRFTKAATAGGAALNLSNRTLGSNARKQKLTEAAGTNPSKMGGGLGNLAGAPDGPKTSHNRLNPKYAQDTAPHKSQENPFNFSVGGPGFPKPWK